MHIQSKLNPVDVKFKGDQQKVLLFGEKLACFWLRDVAVNSTWCQLCDNRPRWSTRFLSGATWFRDSPDVATLIAFLKGSVVIKQECDFGKCPAPESPLFGTESVTIVYLTTAGPKVLLYWFSTHALNWHVWLSSWLQPLECHTNFSISSTISDCWPQCCISTIKQYELGFFYGYFYLIKLFLKHNFHTFTSLTIFNGTSLENSVFLSSLISLVAVVNSSATVLSHLNCSVFNIFLWLIFGLQMTDLHFIYA